VLAGTDCGASWHLENRGGREKSDWMIRNFLGKKEKPGESGSEWAKARGVFFIYWPIFLSTSSLSGGGQEREKTWRGNQAGVYHSGGGANLFNIKLRRG